MYSEQSSQHSTKHAGLLWIVGSHLPGLGTQDRDGLMEGTDLDDLAEMATGKQSQGYRFQYCQYFDCTSVLSGYKLQ